MAKAIVLTSGGLDSSTVLAMARHAGYRCYTLAFDYGQRSRSELNAAAAVSQALGAEQHRVITMDFGALGGSALTDTDIAVPEQPTQGVPITYVPARNTVFLSMALGWAEILGAHDIFIGVSAVDYSGYPDCRPVFIEQFERLANVATKAGTEGQKITIHAPLLHLSKAQTVARGLQLGVDYRLTVSCYQALPDGSACGRCDSCRLRRQGFEQQGVADPTRYA